MRFTGFRGDHPLSCSGRDISAGPDAVLPLTLRETSDVDISAQPGTDDAIAVALRPADQCASAAWELECVNGGFSIGGIATFRASRVPPGDYVLILATQRGVEARVNASIRASRPRAPADFALGRGAGRRSRRADRHHGLRRDGRPRHHLRERRDRRLQRGVDAVRWVLDEPRDVIVHIDGVAAPRPSRFLDVSPTWWSPRAGDPRPLADLPHGAASAKLAARHVLWR
ncbi:MAG: hypothetical protein U0325_30515 [Polyangiales bacterium]